MFSSIELNEIIDGVPFKTDFDWIRQSMVSTRFNQPFLFDEGASSRLSYFAECVLCSAVDWSANEGDRVCRLAAEITELLSTLERSTERAKYLRLRAALLYELANLPARSSTILQDNDLFSILNALLRRTGNYKFLQTNGNLRSMLQAERRGPTLEVALSQDAFALAAYEQGDSSAPDKLVSDVLGDVAKELSFDLRATDVQAFSRVIRNRLRLATRSNIDTDLFEQAKRIHFPAELWSNQVDAIEAGLLEDEYDSWGFAAPTGTGKTFLARLLILKTIKDKPDGKVLYLVPTRALVYEVATSLNSALSESSYSVQAISPQLIDLDETELDRLDECSVAVLTPEKADLLLRLGADFINEASLVVVDEAHHIEDGSRGVLLELYLWRIKKLLGDQARIIFLSAVAPNIMQLAQWLGTNPNGITRTQRATRMRVGVYRVAGTGQTATGWIEYSDGTKVGIVDSNVQTAKRKGLVQLAERMGSVGPVLVVAKGKRECENLAVAMRDWQKERGTLRDLSEEEAQSDVIQRLDSRLEREMYAAVEMRELLRNRIAYHHAGLPPRVRMSVEDAVRENLIDYVFATTTLAEGVNFPFSTVIVQSLALREPPEKGRPARYHPVTPRSFWNIAGRAGRPGRDREGQAILFEPSLGLHHVNAVLEHYLNPYLGSIAPVQSALGLSLDKIAEGISSNEFTADDLTKTVLDKALPKEVHGAINLLRVGLVHARGSGIITSPEDIVDGSFAAQGFSDTQKKTASAVIAAQNTVIDAFLSEADSLSVELISELGISLETLQLLREYVRQLEDWAIRRMSQVMYGADVNLTQAPYIVGPVAKRMTELEGSSLGGLYSDVIVHWLSGVPLTVVRSRAQNRQRLGRLEDLISVIYSRIQYLLPWGLYAMHRIVEAEASRRNIAYNDEIKSLAYLADAGVPNFDALRLVGQDIERVDATRLSLMYRRLGGARRLNMDIMQWLIVETPERIQTAVTGTDRRRLDYDLFAIIEDIRSSTRPT